MTMISKYTSSCNCTFNINFHIMWTTKYRKKLLSSDMQEILKDTLVEKSNEIDIIIKAIEIMSDHVHLFISTKQTINISKTINILKGYSSYFLRKKYPQLQQYKSLWTNSYFCESIGYVSQKSIIKYINNQKYK